MWEGSRAPPILLSSSARVESQVLLEGKGVWLEKAWSYLFDRRQCNDYVRPQPIKRRSPS